MPPCGAPSAIPAPEPWPGGSLHAPAADGGGLTSLLCALLLARGYRRSGARLLLWAALCFAGLALNNLLLFIDLRVVPGVDLSVWRSLPALAGLVVLIYGLVWDTR